MAASGYKDIQVTEHDVLRFSWSEIPYEADNYSIVDWTVQLIADQYGAIISTAKKTGSVTIEGVTYPFQNLNVGITAYASKTLMMGSDKIYHKTNGTKTFSFSVTQQFDITFGGKPIGTITGSGEGTLTNFMRYARITSAPLEFTDEENPSFNYTNPMGTEVSKVEACISSDGYAIEVAYRSLPLTGTSYTFTDITNEERKALRALVTKGTSTQFNFYIKTTYKTGGTNISKYVPARTLNLVNASPLIKGVAIEDVNPVTTSLTGDPQVFVLNASNMRVSVSAEARKEATIPAKGCSITNGIKTVSANEATFIAPSEKLFNCVVTDSRGITARRSVQAAAVIPYIKPTVSFTLDTPEATDTTLTGIVSGNYFSGSFGAKSNTFALYYRIKIGYNDYSDWTNLYAIPNNGTYNTSFSIPNMDYRNAYTVQFKIEDAIYEVVSEEINILVKPVFDWSKNDFNFNVPVTIEGQPLADFVIDYGTETMGTNGTWYWRKWKSGRAEAWGSRNFGRMAVTTAWGNLYRSGVQEQMLPGCFTYTPDVINIKLVDSDFGGWICKHELINATAETTGGFVVVRPGGDSDTGGGTATLARSQITFYVAGRWK